LKFFLVSKFILNSWVKQRLVALFEQFVEPIYSVKSEVPILEE